MTNKTVNGKKKYEADPTYDTLEKIRQRSIQAEKELEEIRKLLQE